jgi:hypothetical protein
MNHKLRLCWGTEGGNLMVHFCNDFLYQCVSKEVSLLITDELLVHYNFNTFQKETISLPEML